MQGATTLYARLEERILERDQLGATQAYSENEKCTSIVACYRSFPPVGPNSTLTPTPCYQHPPPW